MDEEVDLPFNRYLDRELSWLAFNKRVLELAADPSVPLLERVNFLGIFASNLDEFFMVRVAGSKRRIVTGIAVPSNTGIPAHEVLDNVLTEAKALQEQHAKLYSEIIKPELAKEGINILRWDDLDDTDKENLDEYFSEQVFPILMPLAVDPAHPFPYISGLSINLAVRIKNPKTGKNEFARLKIPAMIPRLIQVKRWQDDGSLNFLPLEELIANHLDQLFPGMEILDHHTFRVTRNEDLAVEEDETENLIQALEQELLRRKFGPPIRLEVADDIDQTTLDLLIRELRVGEKEVFVLPEPLDLTAMFQVAAEQIPHLHYPPQVPLTSMQLGPSEPNATPDFFGVISKQDVLVHHPYESFSTSVQAFLEEAARDPQVLAIKQTLYRTSGDSPIVEALIDAAEAGKQVLALVEIKARFDEQANITWARKLERAGVHVVYGLVGLKTHSKLALVLRQEEGNLKFYSHIGTGNYNPKTSRIYEDLGLFTSSDEVGKELTRLFNELSGYAIEKKFKRLLVAPRYMRNGLLKLINQEIEYAKDGKPASIRIKVNSIVDEVIIDALYRASQAGVKVELLVRGICSVMAGVPGLSENIVVRSVLGRHLEHSRVFAFGGGGEPKYLIGSADMMHRNLDRRVEVLVQLTDPSHGEQIDTIFDIAFSDDTAAWDLHPDGTWVRNQPKNPDEPLKDYQEEIYNFIASRKRPLQAR